MHNMVINFFGNDMAVGGYYSLRSSHLAAGLLSYALIDFDLSIMLPHDVQRGTFKLSRKESWVGTYAPSDTSQGEFDYDPFAYDVGTLGVVFCEWYQVRQMLRPLLGLSHFLCNFFVMEEIYPGDTYACSIFGPHDN